MATSRRTDRRKGRGLAKAEQAAETRAELLAAARRLFAERTYAGTSTEAILGAARVTRGALYYHFEDKAQLLQAVCAELYRELGERITLAAQGRQDSWSALKEGCEAFLSLSHDAALVRLLFVDGPAVLGRPAWQRIEQDHGHGALLAGLEAAAAEGHLPRVHLPALAALLNGALNELLLWVSEHRDPLTARREARRCLGVTLEALRAAPPS